MALALLSLAACGGGGGSSTQTTQDTNPDAKIALSTQTISIAATTTQVPPSINFQSSVSGLDPGELVYLSVTTTHNGILSVTPSPGQFLPVTLAVLFKAPDAMAPGNYDDTVQVSFCFDQACTQPLKNAPQSIQVHYTVTQSTFTLASLAPSSTLAGGAAFTLTVTGTSFTPQSRILWNSSGQPTTFVSATQLTTLISASEVADSGAASVRVTDPTNGNTSEQFFTIQRASLAVTELAPDSATVGGGPFTLAVRGAGFSSGSVAQWNGTPLTTTYLNDETLLVQVQAANISSVGTAMVTVTDPTNIIGSAGPQTETIATASKDAVSVGINAAHTGAVDFANISFPTSASWSVDIGGTAYYILVAQGKVIVPETELDGTIDMIALDQATGSTAWGPVTTNGRFAAYDDGRVYVADFVSDLTTATLTAYDVNTGTKSWSTTLTAGHYFFSPIPTAAGGTVYMSDGYVLYAVDEKTGALLWTQSMGSSGSGTPAVSAAGVYYSGECQAQDFLPGTGDMIWSYQGACTGGGDSSPVLNNQLVYAPNAGIFDAGTGTLIGNSPLNGATSYGTVFEYNLLGGTLSSIKLTTNQPQWNFTGDGQLNRGPIAVGQYVLIASNTGNLYALDGTSGSQVWNVNLSSIYGTNPFVVNGALTAGDGLFVVSWGSKIIVYTLSTNP